MCSLECYSLIRAVFPEISPVSALLPSVASFISAASFINPAANEKPLLIGNEEIRAK